MYGPWQKTKFVWMFSKQEITDILAVGETKINGFFPTAQCYMSGYHNP